MLSSISLWSSTGITPIAVTRRIAIKQISVFGLYLVVSIGMLINVVRMRGNNNLGVKFVD